MDVKKILPWLVPAVLVPVACVFCFGVSGCGFLGLVLLGIAGIWILFRLLTLWQKHRPKPVGRIKRVMAIVLLLFALAALVTLIPILRGPAQEQGWNEYLIVLGAGVQGTEPSEILRDRIDCAYQYLMDHPDVICIATGGKGSDEHISEARCIYGYLTAMGIDGDRIWMEERATSTIENFRYSIALIQDKTGAVPQRVTVLSNEFHLFRAGIMAKDCGLEADFVAAPTEKSLIRISYTIREIFALWKYLTIGG